MEIKELIKSRRTVHQFKPEPGDDAIRAAIEQSIWAPNHCLTQPGGFTCWVLKAKTGSAC